jgi:hypothetical protein
MMLPIVAVSLMAALAQGSHLPRIDEVAWLRGCWELQTREGSVEAQWLSPRASSMLGVSRTIHGTRLVDYDMALIREGGERLSYEAHPSDGEPDLFVSVAIGDRRVEFENLKPKYPSRIGYELTAAGRLLEWTDGLHDGKTGRTESAFDRVSCPGE